MGNDVLSLEAVETHPPEERLLPAELCSQKPHLQAIRGLPFYQHLEEANTTPFYCFPKPKCEYLSGHVGKEPISPRNRTFQRAQLKTERAPHRARASPAPLPPSQSQADHW